MEKYVLLQKIIATDDWSCYAAEDKMTRKPLMIKKLKKHYEWEKLLNSREISLMKDARNSRLARLLELVKHKKHFYMVHEYVGENLEAMIKKHKFSMREVMRLAGEITKLAEELISKDYTEDIELDMLFFNKSHIKMSITPKNEDEMLLNYQYLSPERLMTMETDSRSLVFCIGCLIAQLMLQQPLIRAQTRKQYLQCMNDLFPTQPIQSILSDLPPPALENSLSYRLKPHCSLRSMMDLLHLMLKVSANQRISLKQVDVRLNHMQFKNSEIKLASSWLTSQSPQKYLKLQPLPPRSSTKIKTQMSQEFQKVLRSTPSYRLHRTVKKLKKNPQKYRYDKMEVNIPFRPPYRHKSINFSKPTYYARLQPSPSGTSIHEYIYE